MALLTVNTMHQIVKNGYEYNQYNQKYRSSQDLTQFEQFCLEKFFSLLPEHSTVLDLGCGSAYTYDNWIVNHGYKLVGVDFSHAQIVRALKNCPKGKFVCSNMLTFPITFEYGSITMFYSLYHIHRSLHRSFLQKIYNQSARDCIILLNIRKEDSGDFKYKSDFCNDSMCWSHYSIEEFLSIIKSIGFSYQILGDEKEYGGKESHVWLLMSK